MGAAEKSTLGLVTVADDLALTVLAGRREYVNRALEAVEGVFVAVMDDGERPMIGVSADFAPRHGAAPIWR
jgi:hypothetical protein